MASNHPVIVGCDAVSALGTDLETQWERAVKGHSGIDRLTRFSVPEGFPVRISGEVADIDTNPYPFLSPRSLALWPSPIFKYAMLVVHRALAKSGIDITPSLSPRVAVTFSSAVGGQDAVLAPQADHDPAVAGMDQLGGLAAGRRDPAQTVGVESGTRFEHASAEGPVQ